LFHHSIANVSVVTSQAGCCRDHVLPAEIFVFLSVFKLFNARLFSLVGKMGAVWHHSFATRKTVEPAFQVEHSDICCAVAHSLSFLISRRLLSSNLFVINVCYLVARSLAVSRDIILFYFRLFIL
jgi:hypothetical protein